MANTGRGFSLVETLVVLALVSVGSAVALVQMKSSIAIVDADKASGLVVTQLRYARQVAVDQRRNVLVEFVGSDQIRLTRQDGGGSTTVVSDVRLPAGYTFSKPAGIGDTPDAFGDGAPVYFNGGASGTFLADGIFVNGSNLLNGSVFTMGANTGSARAVTLMGSSGRTATYWLKGTAWEQQ